ncbi:MAG: carboxypeptidase-like regulatory domain-containing protein [Bacteroidales bacterium]|nr:carboxypeptidase-like regulatory domain-containing protein [Bacteroidales bacterium]
MNLLHYIQGRRKGKEAHRIEREAMQDAFLREALEGFESVESDHATAIRRMQQQITDRSHPKGRRILLRLSVAASVALVIGFGWYFLLHETPQTSVLSEATPTETPVNSMRKDKKLAATEQALRQESKESAMQDRSQQRAGSPSAPPAAANSEMIVEEMDISAVELMEMEEAGTEAPVEPVTPKPEEPFDELQKPTPAVAEALQGKAKDVLIREASSPKAARQIRGKVVDESGDPMPGVNIAVKNRAAGVVTDAEGGFALNVDDHATLQASFIGYETQEIKVDTSQLLIAMHEDARQLDEVVVVGYGVQRKASVIGSAVAVEESEPQTIVPEPTIGRRAYRKYLRESLIAPTDGECAGMKGKVRIRFNIDSGGRPHNLQVIRKLCDSADREAMRLITEGCDWTQGNTEVTVTVDF